MANRRHVFLLLARVFMDEFMRITDYDLDFVATRVARQEKLTELTGDAKWRNLSVVSRSVGPDSAEA